MIKVIASFIAGAGAISLLVFGLGVAHGEDQTTEQANVGQPAPIIMPTHEHQCGHFVTDHSHEPMPVAHANPVAHTTYPYESRNTAKRVAIVRKYHHVHVADTSLTILTTPSGSLGSAEYWGRNYGRFIAFASRYAGAPVWDSNGDYTYQEWHDVEFVAWARAEYETVWTVQDEWEACMDHVYPEWETDDWYDFSWEEYSKSQ